ncbi:MULTISPECIES: SirB1 family protein [Pseudomonas]|uniref:SirB1 family protein n=1 Tax=Pseudomonas TaxID=286 RepID=UPI0030024357
MNPRAMCIECLSRQPSALLEAALWLAAEHDSTLQPALVLEQFGELQRQIDAALPSLPPQELAQPLLRQLSHQGFRQDDSPLLTPRVALLHRVLQWRCGQPLSLAIIALELARRLGIALQGINFPGYFLLRVPGADHLLDPCSGRRLYPQDQRELLLRTQGANAKLQAGYLQVASDQNMLQRLSRNLRELHTQADDYLAALKDAERVLQLGEPSAPDHLARAHLLEQLECPQAARFDLQRAMLLTEDESLRYQLAQRLRELQQSPAIH